MNPHSDSSEGKEKDCAKPPLKWKLLEQEYVEWIGENADKDIELTDLNETLTEIVEPPNELTVQLYRFQKEWLSWAMKQEEDVRGSILADEMGLGKTVQAIALVLTKQNEICCVSGDLPSIKGTLVIFPVSAVKQWECEIQRHTLKGSVKVFTYHGAGRHNRLGELSDYDFVITTYSIVEREYSASLMPKELPCDLELGTRSINGGESVLHSEMWRRIILDEAHYIKERSSMRKTAVVALKSLYKWVLSGTPVQNQMGDLCSIVQFLQIFPYSYYLCNDCECYTLHYRPSKRCSDCGHTYFRHFSWWKKYVTSQILADSQKTWGRRQAMIFLKHKILKSIMLRRTKNSREPDLKLPLKLEIERWVSLSTVEEDYYQRIQEKTNAHIQQGPNYFRHIQLPNLLVRKRQAVNHPCLVEYSDFKMQMRAKTCASCAQSRADTMVTPCEHLVCNSCLIEFAGQKYCPLCTRPVPGYLISDEYGKEQNSRKLFRPSSILNGIDLDKFQSSTKTDALREEIRFMVERDGTAKGLVFSDFSSFLDLIQHALEESKVKCARIDGSMSEVARQTGITRFTADPNCRIFLMTLKAGGVALNLTFASHVFLMEPCWNPAVEKQAMDRVHRMGSINRPVDEKLWKLQKKKNLVFEGTVEKGSDEALAELTIDELYSLLH